MELTIIIVNWNTKELLKNCLSSIQRCVQTNKVRTVVVDNASSDGSPAMVSELFPDVELIQSGGNIGFGKANNLALARIETPLVLFLNPDTVVLENSIQGMLGFMNDNPSVAAVGCKTKYPDGRAQQLLLQWFPSPLRMFYSTLFLSENSIQRTKNFFPYWHPDKSGFVLKLAGACLMVRKDVLDKVGYFDERFFMYCEDADLCKRIINNGGKIYYLSENEIIHYDGGASIATENQFTNLMMCESTSQFIEKYYGRLGKYQYRTAVAIASYVRLMLLLLIKFLYPSFFLKNKIGFCKSINKYTSMIKWSFGLTKPVIAK